MWEAHSKIRRLFSSSQDPRTFNESFHIVHLVGQANSPRNFPADTPQIIKASELNNLVEASLGRCFTDSYVLVSQPGATAADYDRKDSIPQMQARMLGKEDRISSKFAVRDVVGQISLERLSKLLQDKCDAGTTMVDASSEHHSRDAGHIL